MCIRGCIALQSPMVRYDVHQFVVRALSVDALTLWRMVFSTTRPKSPQRYDIAVLIESVIYP